MLNSFLNVSKLGRVFLFSKKHTFPSTYFTLKNCLLCQYFTDSFKSTYSLIEFSVKKYLQNSTSNLWINLFLSNIEHFYLCFKLWIICTISKKHFFFLIKIDIFKLLVLLFCLSKKTTITKTNKMNNFDSVFYVSWFYSQILNIKSNRV